MRCPICSEEVRDTDQAERWGPEYAHATCVAAYNAGAGAVRKAGRQVPDFAETRKYVRTVMQIYQFLLPPTTLQLRARTQAPSPFSIR